MLPPLLLLALCPSAVFAWQGGHRDSRVAAAAPARRHLTSRADHSNIAYDGVIDDEYDFVIAGGGTAGLVLAARLTEDANATVLVLEAGDSGDAVRHQIDVPGYTYFNSLMNGPVNWGYQTIEQSGLSGRTLPFPRGKVLGGSSAVNGLYVVRPSKLEVDAWAALGNASDTLNWDKLLAGMKKSESFAQPADDVASAGNIQYDPASHGTDGPIHIGWPGYMHPLVGQWQGALAEAQIGYTKDPNNGDNWGGYVATSSINPTNWTRSYARSGYIDPLPPRPNLAILVNATVTKIIFNLNSTTGNQRATGVNFAPSQGAKVRTVKARREVIVAGGAVASPQILMLSGIGPPDVLQAAGVPVVLGLPGVGQNLRDHLSAGVVWKTDADTVATMAASAASSAGDNVSAGDYSSVDPKLLSFVNSATAYVSAKQLFADPSAFYTQLEATRQTANTSNLVPSTDPTVRAGYDALYRTEANEILQSDVGAVEILLGLMGTGAGGARSLQVQAGIQHPLSTGRLWITSADAFEKPQIDPGYLTHPQDITVLREGLKLARRVGKAAGLGAIAGSEITPGENVQSDEDWEKWIRGNVYTEYHPSGSCALLPKAQGGVVDHTLTVYGTDNLRVIDASVFTVAFSAHLMAPTYGLAEVAADMIRAQYNLPPVDPSASSSSSSSSVSGTATGTSEPASSTGNTNTSNTNNNAAGRSVSSASIVAVLGALVAAFAF